MSQHYAFRCTGSPWSVADSAQILNKNLFWEIVIDWVQVYHLWSRNQFWIGLKEEWKLETSKWLAYRRSLTLCAPSFSTSSNVSISTPQFFALCKVAALIGLIVWEKRKFQITELLENQRASDSPLASSIASVLYPTVNWPSYRLQQ